MPQHTCQCLRLSGHSGPHPRDIESRSQSPDRSWRTGPSSSHWGHWDPRRSLQPRHRPRYWAFVELRQVRVRGCPGSTCSFLDDQSPSLLTIDCSGLANSPVTWHTTLSIFDICTGPGVSQSRKSRRSGRFRSFLRSASARVRAGAAHARPAQAAEYATSHSHSGVRSAQTRSPWKVTTRETRGRATNRFCDKMSPLSFHSRRSYTKIRKLWGNQFAPIDREFFQRKLISILFRSVLRNLKSVTAHSHWCRGRKIVNDQSEKEILGIF